MKHFYWIISFCLICFIQCRLMQRNTSTSKDSILESIEIDGIERKYIVYLPKTKIQREEKIPLLLMLHGRFGTAKLMMESYNMNAIADRERFAVIYPDGYNRSWADGRGGTPADKNNIDDVKFLESVIQRLTVNYPIDQNQIFITGHSNGGFMTQRMLIEKTHLFKAGVSVTAHISKNVLMNSSPTKPISVAFISGTEDPLVPYDGGYVVDGEEVLGAEDSVRRWIEWNQCSKQPAVEKINRQRDETSLEIYSCLGCKENVKVRLYKLIGAGHMWPGLSQKIPFINLGKETKELNASEEIWDFFKLHL
ncbi:MAG TPA: prolyl oligopeptidase family serine peptidase [Leptospiraceae bacterium]|nr:prolyl oligopeptidase family serine peptidase [Leptospiraceae bacterium]